MREIVSLNITIPILLNSNVQNGPCGASIVEEGYHCSHKGVDNFFQLEGGG